MQEAIVTIMGTILLAVVGWALSMSTRLSVVEQRMEDLTKLMESKFDAASDRMVERFEHINSMLEGRTENINQIPFIASQLPTMLTRLERIERFLNGSFKAFVHKESRDGQ